MDIYKASMVVAVYNAEPYINRCLESILSQNFNDYEVILVDDGSTDSSAKICDEYAEKYDFFRTIHKNNGGVSSARQTGLDNAKGEYVIHIDPDDWIEKNLLRTMYEKALTENADMVICDFIVEEKGKKYYSKQEPTDLDHFTVLNDLFMNLHGSCCNKLIRRELFTEYNIRFRMDLSYCEDLFLNACVLKNPVRVAYVNEALYHYDRIVNSNSLVNKYTKKTYEEDRRLLEIFIEEFSDTAEPHNMRVRLNIENLERGYRAYVFSSKEFAVKFREQIGYTKLIKGLHRWFVFFSCIGFYKPMYKMEKTVHGFVDRFRKRA